MGIAFTAGGLPERRQKVDLFNKVWGIEMIILKIRHGFSGRMSYFW